MIANTHAEHTRQHTNTHTHGAHMARTRQREWGNVQKTCMPHWNAGPRTTQRTHERTNDANETIQNPIESRCEKTGGRGKHMMAFCIDFLVEFTQPSRRARSYSRLIMSRGSSGLSYCIIFYLVRKFWRNAHYVLNDSGLPARTH